MDKFKQTANATKEQQADNDLKKILTTSNQLNTDYSGGTKWGTLPGPKLRRPSTGSMRNLTTINGMANGNANGRQMHAYRHSVHIETYTEGEDEILESLV